MIEKPVHIKFKNSQNPNADFDMIKLEEIFVRRNIDHSPFSFHLVNFYIIFLIEEGQGSHIIDFAEYSFGPGTILTIRKDQIHKFIKNNNVKGTLLLFTEEFMVSYLEQMEALRSLQLFNELLGEPKIQLSDSEFKLILNLIEQVKTEYFIENDEYSLGIIRSELHILITYLYRIKSRKEQVFSKRKYLNEFIQLQNIVEKNVTKTIRVQDYSRMMCVSAKTLNNITKSIINKPAKEFIDEVCTKQIKRLLINTKLPVKEIAYISGFEETTNFYKYFKRQTQLTPEQFREGF